MLPIADIDAVRAVSVSRGVAIIREVCQAEPPPALQTFGHSYVAYASFIEPGGEPRLLPRVTTRIPGSEWMD